MNHQIIVVDNLSQLLEFLPIPSSVKQGEKRAKYVRVGEVIPMVFGKLHYVKSISLNAELNLVSFKLNSGTSIIRDFDDTLPTLGNLYACEAM